MRSPAEAWRRWGERAMRSAALLLLGWLAWQTLRPAATPRRVERLEGAELAGELRRLSGASAPDSLWVALRAAPGDTVRAWLAALRRSGVPVGWTDEGVPALALELYPAGDPVGTVSLLLAAPAGARAAVADALGPLDTLALGRLGGALRMPAPSGAVSIALGEQVASVALGDSLVPPAVLLLARAGWEAKFLAAALEEAGWRVATRLEVAPGLAVRQGDTGALDLRHFGAVVAVDAGAASDAAAIRAFVAAGGGLVLLGDAAAAPALRALTAEAERAGGPVVAGREGEPTTRARRVGAGRVVQVDDAETWSWRMGEAEGDEEAHRAWWSALVASVAYRDATPRTAAHDPAPRASLFAALGPPGTAPVEAAPPRAPRRLPAAAFAALVAVLLGEWASRRLRGAR